MDFTGKTFDDFLLKPHFGVVKSRKEISTQMDLGGYTLDVPVMSANMDMLEGIETQMACSGGVSVVHRNTGVLHQAYIVQETKKHGLKVGAAVGLDDIGRVDALQKAGADFVIVDIAHGACIEMVVYLKRLRAAFPDLRIGAGNVATREGALLLKEAGAHFIKVGIGAGRACLTRQKTGFGVPQLQAIWECSKVAPIIADGGIRNEKDIFMSLACGASAVMLGSFLAKGSIRGMSSKEADPEQTAPPEGYVITISDERPIYERMSAIKGYLQSSVSYTGATNLREAVYQIRTRPDEYFIDLSVAARKESYDR